MTPYNIKYGQTFTTDIDSVSVDGAFVAHIQIPAVSAIAPSATAVLAATALTDAAQVIKTNITNPAIPRNVSVTGNASGIVGNVVVKGTNYADKAITETIALNGTATVAGVKAFKAITEIDLPIQTNASGDTVSVGIGSILGLPYKLAHNTVLAAYVDNVKEATAPTVTTDAVNIENDTVALTTALSGKIVDMYLIV
jgi:hypothetical protein